MYCRSFLRKNKITTAKTYTAQKYAALWHIMSFVTTWWVYCYLFQHNVCFTWTYFVLHPMKAGYVVKSQVTSQSVFSTIWSFICKSICSGSSRSHCAHHISWYPCNVHEVRTTRCLYTTNDSPRNPLNEPYPSHSDMPHWMLSVFLSLSTCAKEMLVDTFSIWRAWSHETRCNNIIACLMSICL